MSFLNALALIISTLSLQDLEAVGVKYEVMVGDQHVPTENSSPPRIVIIPINTTPMGQMQQGPKGIARVLQRELTTFEAVLWHVSASQSDLDDYAIIQTMRAVFAASMRATFGSSFQLLGSSYDAQRGESFLEFGRLAVQQFTLETSLIDTGDVYATITSAIENIGISDTGSTDVTAP